MTVQEVASSHNCKSCDKSLTRKLYSENTLVCKNGDCPCSEQSKIIDVEPVAAAVVSLRLGQEHCYVTQYPDGDCWVVLIPDEESPNSDTYDGALKLAKTWLENRPKETPAKDA